MLAYLNLDMEWLPMDNEKLNLKMNQECLDRAFVSWHCDTFKINNVLVFHILWKIFMEMDAYVYGLYIHEAKRGYTGWSSCVLQHSQAFLSSYHVVSQVVERKLQNSHYDGEKKGWDWNKYVALHKEQHTIMASLGDCGYSGIDDST